MIKRLLIANRGEISCRIIEVARSLSIETYAIYSELDRNSRHVKMADRSLCVGPEALSESYLNREKIITVAQKAGVDAIHPGYGFLSESAEFARACQEAGIIFVGPSPQTLDDMGSKKTAKAIAVKAGVPVIPGYSGDSQDLKTLKKEAHAIGYPLMIKAIMGGGGKGMRLVEKEDDFEHALHSCQREAKSSFGDDRVLLEKYLQNPRHIEVQVFGDMHGNHVHMFERDCSPQRRHQKIIEEAPAVGVPQNVKEQIYVAALKLAKAVDYVGAGTVEFLLEPSGDFYFMEMNTRLQVEHPVTEAITGLNLVEWQLHVAAGEPLPLNQDQMGCCGHAIEARIYAEDPQNSFLPSSGHIGVFRPLCANYRLDTYLGDGDEVFPIYDPLMAKVIVSGANRDTCLNQMEYVLNNFTVLGVNTNIQFLANLVRDDDFIRGPAHVAFVDQHLERWLELDETPLIAYRFAAIGLLHEATNQDPWAQGDGWRLVQPAPQTFTLESQGVTQEVNLTRQGDRWAVDGVDRVEIERKGSYYFIQCSKGVMRGFFHNRGNGICDVWFRGKAYTFKMSDPLAEAGEAHAREHHLKAPMTSRVAALHVKAGDQVAQGQPLMVLEAMKMEHAIRAPDDGQIGEIFYQVGDVVEEGEDVMEFHGGGDDSPLAKAS